jgi:hypothetical protein
MMTRLHGVTFHKTLNFNWKYNFLILTSGLHSMANIKFGGARGWELVNTRILSNLISNMEPQISALEKHTTGHACGLQLPGLCSAITINTLTRTGFTLEKSTFRRDAQNASCSPPSASSDYASNYTRVKCNCCRMCYHLARGTLIHRTTLITSLHTSRETRVLLQLLLRDSTPILLSARGLFNCSFSVNQSI